MLETIHGVILAYKPIGYTSRQVVNHYSKILKTKKIGHAGTLDPFAEGLLILLIGKCTSWQNYFLNFFKTYRATLQLGVSTDTLDCEGEIIARQKTVPNIKFSQCEEIIKQYFLGKIKQTPPDYSAIKINGQRCYQLARQKKKIEIPIRTINIKNFIVEKIDLVQNTIDIFVECSSGTYLRTLAADFSNKLGSFSHLIALNRVAIDKYQCDDFLLANGNFKNSEYEAIIEQIKVKKIDFFLLDDNCPFPVHQCNIEPKNSLEIEKGNFNRLIPKLKFGFNVFYWQQKISLIFAYRINLDHQVERQNEKPNLSLTTNDLSPNKNQRKKWQLLYNNTLSMK